MWRPDFEVGCEYEMGSRYSRGVGAKAPFPSLQCVFDATGRVEGGVPEGRSRGVEMVY